MIAIIKKTTGQILLIVSDKLSDKAVQRCLGVSITEVEQLDCTEQAPEVGKNKRQYRIVAGAWEPKTKEELAALSYDEHGKPLPTPEELAAKAEEEVRQAREAEEKAWQERAKAALGAGDWTAEQVAAKVFALKQKEARQALTSAVAAKNHGAKEAVMLSNLPYDERHSITAEQLEIYELKYQAAKNPENPIYSEAEKLAIIGMYELCQKHIAQFLLVIDKCRRVIEFLIDSAVSEEQLEAAKAQIAIGMGFDTLTTAEELDSWAASLGGWRELA